MQGRTAEAHTVWVAWLNPHSKMQQEDATFHRNRLSAATHTHELEGLPRKEIRYSCLSQAPRAEPTV